MSAMPMQQPPTTRGKLTRGPNGWSVKAKSPPPAPSPVAPAEPRATPANVQLRMDVEAMGGIVGAIQQLTMVGQQIIAAIGQLAQAMASIQPPVVNVDPTPINVEAPNVNVEAPSVSVTAQAGEQRITVENRVTADVQLPPPRAKSVTLETPDGTVTGSIK